MEDLVRETLATHYQKRIDIAIEYILTSIAAMDCKRLFLDSLKEGYAGFEMKHQMLPAASSGQLRVVQLAMENKLAEAGLGDVTQVSLNPRINVINRLWVAVTSEIANSVLPPDYVTIRAHLVTKKCVFAKPRSK